jgi:hypothetical protein
MDTSLTMTRTNGSAESAPVTRTQAIASVSEDLLLQIARCRLRIGAKRRPKNSSMKPSTTLPSGTACGARAARGPLSGPGR